jgi:hypothetical protein
MSKNTTARALTCLALAVLPALSTVACTETGSSDIGHRPGAEGVREVIPAYTRALADGDGPGACSLMSEAAQDALKERTESADCLQGVKTASERLNAQSATALREVKMKDPQVNGGNASAELSLDSSQQGVIDAIGSTTLTLVQIDARWHIDAAPSS